MDTGADETGVYSWFAKSLDLPKGKTRELSGATGSEDTTGALLSTLTVDGHTIRNIDADTIPDRTDGAKLADVAGVDLMLRRLVVIDFGCKSVALRSIQNVTNGIAGKGATLIEAGSIAAGIDTQSAAFRDGKPARGATMHSVNSRVGPIGTVQFAGITRIVTRRS